MSVIHRAAFVGPGMGASTCCMRLSCPLSRTEPRRLPPHASCTQQLRPAKMAGMPYGLQSMLKEGHKHFSGVDEAVVRNIEAVKGLAAITRTSLGPNGAGESFLLQRGFGGRLLLWGPLEVQRAQAWELDRRHEQDGDQPP